MPMHKAYIETPVDPSVASVCFTPETDHAASVRPGAAKR